MDKTTVVILGMTGSIGVQALEVIQKMQDFEVLAGTYHSNQELAKELSLKFKVVKIIRTSDGYDDIFNELEQTKPDITLVAVPGFVSLPLTLKAIETSKRVLLASKEALVCGGWMVKSALKKTSTQLLPVDSEHSALMQLYEDGIEKILLTSSGGALRDWDIEKLDEAKPCDVLKHPVWQMGKRITIDSATMVNKGFEILEAYELFNIDVSKIEVLLHREGLVHAVVFLRDGTVKLHMGFPDMRVPIAYALTYPKRNYQKTEWPDLSQSRLSFHPVDMKRYPAFFLAYDIANDYAKRTAYNASDEVAVEYFLSDKIKFTDISKVIEKVVQKIEGKPRDLSDLVEVDKKARRLAIEVIECL
ncbi:1-deoxy-D-xylulose-5-phosphate reductoisomerase [Thermotoga profunda]|uniref:1-deoxy-D-xylulose-5-phosphate reductoisomerase n=1 Tax=Thermotoga profunda TaxID=1508420 RepID=UPI000597CA70|nr:1-deoxy-D-xylulose-5-phosphate reductoisomerase [Thermotoga profunda]